MVPIYAIDSFVSLRFKETALYVDMLRDCYEGYALYLFLALMVGYLGDGDEYKVRLFIHETMRSIIIQFTVFIGDWLENVLH